MTSKKRQQTDPAREFAKMAQFLLGIQGNTQHHSYKLIKNAINGDLNSGAILHVYAVCNRRVEDLASLLDKIEDGDIDEDVRNAGRTAIYGMGKIFSSEFFFRDWGSVINECLPKEHLLALTFLSPIMSRHYPLPAIKPEEIENLIANLDRAYEEINENDTLPLWAKIPLGQGVADLMFVLQNFVLFGQDEAVSRILTLITTANHAVAATEKSSGRKLGLLELCAALALAVDVFAAAPNISQAYATYRGWVVDAMEAAQPLLSPPPRQLEGPKRSDADKPEDA